jgi:hypothetical protein
MFGRPASGLRQGRVAKAALERPVRGYRRRRHDGGPAHGVPHLASCDGRGAPDEEVTALDQLDHTIDRAADKLQELADKAAGQNGLKGKLAEPLAEDAAFLRKLKPSLIAARARGDAPTDEKPVSGSVTPAAPAPKPEKQKRNGDGPNPWLVVAGALVAGIVLAKWIDWRGHAHPRD